MSAFMQSHAETAMEIMRKELLTEPSLVSGVSIREEVAQMSRILRGIHEGKENSGRRIHVPKELEGVLEKGAVWRDMEVLQDGRHIWCRSDHVAGDGAEITGEPARARSDPRLQASLHKRHLSAVLCASASLCLLPVFMLFSLSFSFLILPFWLCYF